MKKICILVCTICVFISAAVSVTPNSAKLTNIEKQLFGYEFQNDSEINRTVRIEEYLYGKASSNSLDARLNKISSDIGLPLDANKIATKNTDSSNKNLKTASKSMVYEKEDSSVQYPIVDKIESRVFGRSFHGENIYARLDRLDKKVFNSTSNDNLSNRVNKLRLAVLDSDNSLDDIATESIDPLSDSYPNSLNDNQTMDDITSSKTAKNNFTYKSPSTSKNDYLNMELTATEETVLHQSFQSDSIDERLDRLEARIFKRSFPKDTDSTRIQRISAATVAHKTSQAYDNNKLMKNLNTGFQIGGILFMILAMIL